MPEPASMIIFDFYSEAGKVWIEGKSVINDSKTTFMTLDTTYFQELT